MGKILHWLQERVKLWTKPATSVLIIGALSDLTRSHTDLYLNQFIQPDTIVPDPRTPADWNRYAYVRNNPINYTDPSGKTPLIPCPNKNNPSCLSKVMELRTEAQNIGESVAAGTLLPV